MSDLFDMGTHTFYVWLAYGVSFASLSGLVLFTIYDRKQAAKQVAAKVKRLNIRNSGS